MQGKCPFGLLGYAYHRSNQHTASRSATLATITFIKKQARTHLRLSYASSVDTYSASGGYARWYFMIDGRRCSKPGHIDMMMYQGSNYNTNVPGYMAGICTATSAGNIGRGRHTITVHVKSTGNVQSGWSSQSFVEVKEICPPF